MVTGMIVRKCWTIPGWFANSLRFNVFAHVSVGVREGKQRMLRQVRSVGNVGGRKLEGGGRRLEARG